MYTSQLLHSLLISLLLTLILELLFALIWGIRKKGLVLVILMNILTNPAVVLLHFFCTFFLGWTGFFPVLLLELAAIVAEAFCCRGIIRKPWLFALCVNLFSYSLGELLQILL